VITLQPVPVTTISSSIRAAEMPSVAGQRKDQWVGPAVIGDHLAAVSAEAREIRVIGADNGVELRLRLPEAGFEASSGQRLPVEARVLLDPKAPVIERERHG
jgi:hypothetical protein